MWDTREEVKDTSKRIVLRDVLRSVRIDDEYEEKSNKTLQWMLANPFLFFRYTDLRSFQLS